MTPQPQDPYKILGITPDAQLPEIRAAHRKLVKLYHPDKIGADASDDEKKFKEDQFKRVQKAYELLSDENARRKYDDQLRLHKRYEPARSAAATASAFSSFRRPDPWKAGVDIRTAEPRANTSSRSPPKDGPEHYHWGPKVFDEQGRHENAKPNIRVHRTSTEPLRARRSPSYESHSSPTDDIKSADRERQLDERERELKRRESAVAEKEREQAKKASKGDKTRSSEGKSARKEKEEKPSRKTAKECPYVEEPKSGVEEVFVSKSASKIKPGKSAHKHRSSKHDRSRSRSQGRAEKPIKKKESRDKSRLRPEPEVEEPDDSDSGAESPDDMARKIDDRASYINQCRRPFPPNAPTPPPASGGVKPPLLSPMERGDRTTPIVVDASPSHRHTTSPKDGHPLLQRGASAPQPGTFSRPIPISVDVQFSPYESGPNNNRGRSRSRLNQGYFAEDEEVIVEDPHGRRSRRGSSNAYPTQQNYPGRPSYGPIINEHSSSYFEQYYPTGTSPQYGTGHMPAGSTRHVSSTTPPFAKVHVGRPYDYSDVTYSQVPRQGQYPADAPQYV